MVAVGTEEMNALMMIEWMMKEMKRLVSELTLDCRILERISGSRTLPMCVMFFLKYWNWTEGIFVGNRIRKILHHDGGTG